MGIQSPNTAPPSKMGSPNYLITRRARIMTVLCQGWTDSFILGTSLLCIWNQRLKTKIVDVQSNKVFGSITDRLTRLSLSLQVTKTPGWLSSCRSWQSPRITEQTEHCALYTAAMPLTPSHCSSKLQDPVWRVASISNMRPTNERASFPAGGQSDARKCHDRVHDDSTPDPHHTLAPPDTRYSHPPRHSSVTRRKSPEQF